MFNVKNQQWLVESHATGTVNETNYKLSEEEISELKEGELLVRNVYLSLDPTNRVWMDDKDTYMPALQKGEVMRGLAIGAVEESHHADFKKGDIVYGLLGWQKYFTSNGEGLIKLPVLPNMPLFAHFGLLGHIGLTAHYGLLKIAEPKEGETVLVSAAAGAVGSLVGQIAKLKGCYVVGIAGSDEKCDWIVNELGFDKAINYKKEPIAESIAKACPNGIDIYFDNVGGETLDAVLGIINDYGRVVACGMISAYNQTKPVFTSENMVNIVTRRVLIKGFVCLDHPEYAEKAYGELLQWYSEGKVKYRVDVVSGLENSVQALNKLFDGSNQGKLIVKVSEE